MKEITQEINGNVIINKVNLLRATINEAVEFRNLLDEQIAIDHSKIVVDLSQCTQLDTTFLGVLVVTQKKLLTNGGGLKIVDPLDPAKEMFYLTGTSKIFDTFETTEDAIKSFNNEIKPPEPKSVDVIPKKNMV